MATYFGEGSIFDNTKRVYTFSNAFEAQYDVPYDYSLHPTKSPVLIMSTNSSALIFT